MGVLPWLLTLTFSTLTLASLGFVYVRRRRERQDEVRVREAVEQNLHVPQSLHPVIDTDRCIGSLSCISACPEGDILGIVDGKAHLVRGANCIGHGKCALECPVGAIQLVFGTSERGVDLPEVDASFESSRRGVHVVGELGGMGLIRNAIRQGLDVADGLKARLASVHAHEGAADIVDVAIVGAGPAGLATALGCRAQGLSFRLLEQGSMGGAIANYPRQKVVMTESVRLPLVGRFGKRLISKEELLESWSRATAKADIQVEEKTRVTGIDGEDGDFTVYTSRDPVRARKVVLATGRRGTPRKLGVPGEDLAKVSYQLIDPAQYDGCRVLVVGGGDSALEAAIQLAEEAGAEVTLSYHGDAFSRARQSNRQRLQALVDAGRVSALMSSRVQAIAASEVQLQQAGRTLTIDNDYVIVNIGGELPVEFLRHVGVGLRTFKGEGLTPKAESRRGSAAVDPEEQADRRLSQTLLVLGALIIAALTLVGWDYYLLSPAERLESPLHESLRPAGTWGHGVGIVATALMLSNFLYALRKRWRRLKGRGPIRRWLTFHTFVGLVSPIVIAFHAAFQSNNLLASGTATAMTIVVLTGLVGRYLHAWVPSQEGRALELEELKQRQRRLEDRLQPLIAKLPERATLEAVLAQSRIPEQGASLAAFLLLAPFHALLRALRLRQLRSLFPSEEAYRDFHGFLQRVARIRYQVGYFPKLRRLMSVWRVLHVVISLFLVVLIAAHIAVSLYLGYRWIVA